jgi:hypothetical protein
MMLAVIHHMVVTDRIPLRDVLKLASELTTNALIIEFVPPGDPKFRKIARGRDHLHADLDQTVFENAAKEFFDIVVSEKLPETERIAYFLKKKIGS